jgi:23S rRNA pseudouridine1911/1915/1917 synthase
MMQNLTEDRILYTDNHLIAVLKRAGEIVQGDKTGDTPLSASVADYIKIKFNTVFFNDSEIIQLYLSLNT